MTKIFLKCSLMLHCTCSAGLGWVLKKVVWVELGPLNQTHVHLWSVCLSVCLSVRYLEKLMQLYDHQT